MTSVKSRPPRTDGHAQRDALIRQFADAGLVPVLSTNGSNPEADIQVAKGPKAGDVSSAWVTQKGARRLEVASPARHEPLGVRVEMRDQLSVPMTWPR